MKNQAVNILMVDDHSENLLALEAVLTSPQYNLIKANSGLEALKWVLREDFAVILMDVQMPEMNGFETAKIIRERDKSKETPIIFITALSQTVENVLHGYSVGAIDYIIKPFDPIILKCKVEGFVALYLSKKEIEEKKDIIYKRTKELELLHTELEKKEAMARAVGETSIDTIVSFATNGTILSINPVVKKMFGYESEEVIGKKVGMLFELSIDDLPRKAIVESIGRRKNGTTFPVEVHLSDAKIGKEEIFVCTIRDITERKQQTEKLSTVGELAAGIAHEIRNPLTSLKGFTQLLEYKLSSENDYVEIMISEIERINTIVSELLLLAKPSKNEFQYVHLSHLIENIKTLMSAQANLHGVEIIENHEVNLHEVTFSGVENKIKQVFINIIKNSIEAMPGGGRVTIETRLCGDRVVIAFKDNGLGIPRNRLQHLGKPFFTTKENGTGLGLMISYSIIENHQGELHIDSEEGRGTTVEVCLPVQRESRLLV